MSQMATFATRKGGILAQWEVLVCYKFCAFRPAAVFTCAKKLHRDRGNFMLGGVESNIQKRARGREAHLATCKQRAHALQMLKSGSGIVYDRERGFSSAYHVSSATFYSMLTWYDTKRCSHCNNAYRLKFLDVWLCAYRDIIVGPYPLN